ncbi:MAG TPA: hypothetical protein DEP84_13535 [Chloroflexi bacterium]|nr:hypothetical protein [Chloroflexota bacterium]
MLHRAGRSGGRGVTIIMLVVSLAGWSYPIRNRPAENSASSPVVAVQPWGTTSEGILHDTRRATPAPVPTLTPTPTQAPMRFSTQSPIPTVQPVAGQPCPAGSHDPSKWHPLIDPVTGCHFNHEHKDNPHDLDDVFGPVETHLRGYSVGLPWQTGLTGTEENRYKHESYGWLVLRNLPPSNSRSQNGAEKNSKDVAFVKNIRVQVHGDLHAGGAATRFHSVWIEAQVCYRANPNDCGIVGFGGHLDYGELRVDGVWVPLPNDPRAYAGLTPPAPERQVDNLIAKRSHSATSHSVRWIGRFAGAVGPIAYAGIAHETKDSWQPIDPADPGAVQLTCPDFECEDNNSTARLDFFILRPRQTPPVTADSRINFKGYTDRFLNVVEDCREPGPDCVPLVFENFPNLREISLQNGGPDSFREYDTSPPGKHWIEYPN